MERKQHVERALAYTVENGDLLTELNPVKIFMRDWRCGLCNLFLVIRDGVKRDWQGKE